MTGVIDIELAPESRAPRRARSALASLEGTVPARIMQALRLLVTELVTNSVRHAGLRSDASIHVVVTRAPDRVRVEVTDPGRGFGRRPPAQHPPEEAGWGLFLVDRVADRWGVSEDGGTLVWFELDRRVRPLG